VALPTDSNPFVWRFIPEGSGGPLGSTPNRPPCATPLGSVRARSNVLPLPTMSVGTAGTQTPVGAVGGDGVVEVGGVVVEGGVVPGGVVPGGVEGEGVEFDGAMTSPTGRPS
jgi:hypothetical protein